MASAWEFVAVAETRMYVWPMWLSTAPSMSSRQEVKTMMIPVRPLSKTIILGGSIQVVSAFSLAYMESADMTLKDLAVKTYTYVPVNWSSN